MKRLFMRYQGINVRILFLLVKKIAQVKVFSLFCDADANANTWVMTRALWTVVPVSYMYIYCKTFKS
jgi:hypothetical protein